MEMDIFTMLDIDNGIRRIEAVLATDIFTQKHDKHPLATAAITEVMICLNDLLQKTKKFGFPVTFTEDVVIVGTVKDITDLVNDVRNTLCHIPSKTRFLEENLKVGKVVLYGKVRGLTLGTTPISSDYADDVCFIFGKVKIYLFRHIYRALIEAKFNVTLLIVFSAFPQFVALQSLELVPLSLQLAIRYDGHL